MTQDRDDGAAVDLDRLRALVEAYGGDAGAWPEQDRSAAVALMAESDEAQRWQAEAAELDRLLGEAPSLEPSAALRRSVLAKAPRPQATWLERLDRWTTWLWPFTPRWQPAAGLVAATVLGLFVGASYPEAVDVTAANEAAEPLELSELAFEVGIEPDVDDEFGERP